MIIMTHSEMIDRAKLYIEDCGEFATKEGLVSYLKDECGANTAEANEIAEEIIFEE